MKDIYSNTSTFEQPSIDTFPFHTAKEAPQVSKHLFTVRPSLHQQRFSELDIFRKQIEQSKAGLHHQPYTSNKKNVFFYRAIFAGIALVFFGLGMTALSLPSVINCGLLFGSCTFLKGLIIGICVMLSLASATVALTLQAEREAVFHCIRRAKHHLSAIYGRKRIRMGVKRFIALFGPQRQQAAVLRQMYHDGLDKINEKKDEAMHLVHRISTAQTLDKQEKESLLNQAIEELNEKLYLLTHTFRHAALPHYT